MNTNQQLIIEIKQKLFNISGKLNSAIIRRNSFLQSELYKHIIDMTPFIEKNVKYSVAERIYCVMNNITTKPLCNICSKPLNFSFFKRGYFLCSNMSCIRQQREWGDCSETKKTRNSNIIENFTNSINTLIEDVSMDDAINFISERTSGLVLKHNCNYVTPQIINRYKNILIYIIQQTNYIPFVQTAPRWGERFYLIKYNTHPPKCIYCGNTCLFKSFKHGYSSVCENKQCVKRFSGKCRALSHFEKIKPALLRQGFQIIDTENNVITLNKVKLLCNTCNNIIEHYLMDGRWKKVYCYKCYGVMGKSKQEKEVVDWLKPFVPSLIENTRTVIPPQELDIYIPDHKLAIEFDGIHWHSDKYIDNDYHLMKTQQCAEKGVQLIHIFSNEWNHHPDIVKSIILNKLHKTPNIIYARECVVKIVESITKRDFLERTHLQGNCNSQINIGLFHQDKLVSVMCIGKRHITRGTPKWEIIRFANELYTQVIGGFAKLISFFEKNYKIDELITYADLRYFNGRVYENNGFVLKNISQPNYWYIVDGELQHRAKFQKHRLNKFLGEKFNSTLSERDNMQNSGYDCVYDCGNKVYIKVYEKRDNN